MNGINEADEDLGLSADQGDLFLGLIWSAVALCFIATLTTTIQLCVPTRDRRYPSSKRRDRYSQQKGPYGMYPMSRDQNGSHYAEDPYSSRRALRWPGDEWEEEDDFR